MAYVFSHATLVTQRLMHSLFNISSIYNGFHFFEKYFKLFVGVNFLKHIRCNLFANFSIQYSFNSSKSIYNNVLIYSLVSCYSRIYLILSLYLEPSFLIQLTYSSKIYTHCYLSLSYLFDYYYW